MRFQFVTFILLFIGTNCYSQNSTITISGIVKSEQNEILTGANVYIKSSNKGSISNENGKFSFQISNGFHKIYCSFLGFNTDSIVRNFKNDTTVIFKLKSTSFLNKDVVVSAKKADDNLSEKTIGIEKINSKEIEKLPSLMGEKDPIRYLQLSAGVQSVGEGFSSFYVRGGNYDQNLILLNKATIYNPSHLFGFYSVFNNEIIDNVILYKGLIPSKYGGRTSSVLNIDVNDGNMETTKANIAIGLLSSKISITGPILKNKISYQFAFRKTYINEVLKPIADKLISDSSALSNNLYGFYDFNGIITSRLNSTNYLKINYYLGKDDFEYNAPVSKIKIGMDWGNSAISAVWKHIFNENSYHEFSVSNSNYKFNMLADEDNYFLKIKSEIKESKLTYTLNKKIKSNNFYAGFDCIYNQVLPGDKSIGFNDYEYSFNDNNFINSGNIAFYVGDNFKIFPNLDIDAGIRANYYAFLGPYKYYLTDYNNFLTDSLLYSNFEIIKHDFSISPRISINYRINEQTSFKAGISFNEQNLHIAEISSVTLPADFWLPTTLNINPQKGKIFSAGIFKNFKDNTIKTNIEAYYKQINNIISYRSGLISNFYEYNIDDNLISGKGKSYGIETEIQYTNEKINAQLSYTYSRTLRQFDEIFDGKPFYAKYDRPHDFTFSIFYTLNEKLSFSAVFVYASGKLVTFPYSRYLIQGMPLNSYFEKNSIRMPDYNRLDISMVYKNKKHKNWQSSWDFSVFNVYNRMNPFFIFPKVTGNIQQYNQTIKAQQVTLFPILPSITYKINF